MISYIWIVGALGYYLALVIWIIAQRTHYFHGKYSHSWMIGTLLLIFGTIQIIGSASSLIASTGLVALVMPLIVTSIDVSDHRREHRGLFGHKSNCWMENKTGRHERPVIKNAIEKENWSSR